MPQKTKSRSSSSNRINDSKSSKANPSSISTPTTLDKSIIHPNPNPNWTTVKLSLNSNPNETFLKNSDRQTPSNLFTKEEFLSARLQSSNKKIKLNKKKSKITSIPSEKPSNQLKSENNKKKTSQNQKARLRKTKKQKKAAMNHQGTNVSTIEAGEPNQISNANDENQTDSNKSAPKTSNSIDQLAFIENADFIRLEDIDQDLDSSNKDRQGTKDNSNDPKTDTKSRGTKRKHAAIQAVTEEEANELRKKKGSIITPWFDKLKWKGRNVQQMLTTEIGSFVAYIRPTLEEDQLRQMVIELIRKTVRSRWPDADVEPFGSFGTKLYLPGGDIDLVILSNRMMDEPKSKILYKLAPIMREKNIGKNVTVIAKAKVPIVKFKTIFGNFNVDISINQSNGLVAMKKVNELLDEFKVLSQKFCSKNRRSSRHHNREQDSEGEVDGYEFEKEARKVVEELGAAKCLILVIKSVLKQRGMNEVFTGGLGSYSIICLVVSFLQLHPKIQRGDIDPNKNLGVLLLEFFELYGKNYNFDETGISVRGGGSYFSKAHRGWKRERQPYLLSIEDPTDDSNDISGGSHNILGVRSVFSGAFDLLTATLYHRHSLQASRANAFNESFRPLLSVPTPNQTHDAQQVTKDPMAESLLGEIMGVTKELVETRKKNRSFFYSGTLQRLLDWPPPPSPQTLKESQKNKKIESKERSSSGKSSRRSGESKSRHDKHVDGAEGRTSKREKPAVEKSHEGQLLTRKNHSHSESDLLLKRKKVQYDDDDFHHRELTKVNSSSKGKGKAPNRDGLPLMWKDDVKPNQLNEGQNFFTEGEDSEDESEGEINEQIVKSLLKEAEVQRVEPSLKSAHLEGSNAEMDYHIENSSDFLPLPELEPGEIASPATYSYQNKASSIITTISSNTRRLSQEVKQKMWLSKANPIDSNLQEI
ncbi:hypothetical protein O181_010624 [Austropuccinia psidii MF-1]|uniref:polynucleotide adenylyltransferase n=1 Tax=Austropuccinia psidii MF-1 TaxID=1389203 RepID=A0A9Q3BRE7_9BASI|nr:hypothetical protein [Austropuccinia psidii MF-1]